MEDSSISPMRPVSHQLDAKRPTVPCDGWAAPSFLIGGLVTSRSGGRQVPTRGNESSSKGTSRGYPRIARAFQCQ